MKNFMLYGLSATALLFAAGCEDDNGPDEGIVKEWTVALSADQEIPSNNRSETGTAQLTLYANNELKYEIIVDGFEGSDTLTKSHIHIGDPVTAGPVSITLVDGDTRTFDGNMAMGSIALTQENIDVIMGDSIYVNVHSKQAPAGLVRGQMDLEVTFADNVPLSADNVVGGSSSIGEASGMAYIRLTKDGDMFYKVDKVEIDNPTDRITEGAIYTGATGEVGEFLQDLSFEHSDIGMSKNVMVNAATIQTLTGEDTYLQLNSDFASDGLMRGQIER